LSSQDVLITFVRGVVFSPFSKQSWLVGTLTEQVFTKLIKPN
jgi:hypothetical protein